MKIIAFLWINVALLIGILLKVLIAMKIVQLEHSKMKLQRSIAQFVARLVLMNSNSLLQQQSLMEIQE